MNSLRTKTALWQKRAFGFLIGYTVLIILWGAFVRLSGSGDGCGEHWPLCHGALIPQGDFGEMLETWIEYAHRAKSGIYGLLHLALMIWVLLTKTASKSFKKISALSFMFTCIEALIGAALVVFGWVDQEESLARMLVMSAHLVNTFILITTLQLSYFLANRQTTLGLREILLGSLKRRDLGPLAALLLIAVTGSWAALSSHLYPATDLWQGILDDFNTESPFFLRIRIVHPIITTILVIYLIRAARHRRSLLYWTIFSWFWGVATLVSLAPFWMKLSHLLFADILWMFWVYDRFCLAEINRSKKQ